MAASQGTPDPENVEAELPDVAYYYPAPYWGMSEGDWLKSLLLFFDSVAILLPRYMRGREIAADPVLAGPMTERGLLRVLEPEEFVDKQVTEQLGEVLVDLITGGAFDGLDHNTHYAELSRSRMGWDADIDLAAMVIDELERRGLAHKSEDGVSVPLHPTVRTTILVLLSQLLRSAGERRGFHFHPVTADATAMKGLVETLSLRPMPSAGHLVALDLEIVSLNLAPVPLDEVVDFRIQHGAAYRAYARDLRRFIAMLSPLSERDRATLLSDRQAELAGRAQELRRTALRAWAIPFASLALGAAGAAWAGVHGDIVSALVTLGAGIVGARAGTPNQGAYSYLFEAQRRLSY